uniref:Uncharacterized protein n=1 Tax=Panagrellus redivivus TaxID=6233 RepID=A0A7E4VCZ9_PANRE
MITTATVPNITRPVNTAKELIATMGGCQLPRSNVNAQVTLDCTNSVCFYHGIAMVSALSSRTRKTQCLT